MPTTVGAILLLVSVFTGAILWATKWKTADAENQEQSQTGKSS